MRSIKDMILYNQDAKKKNSRTSNMVLNIFILFEMLATRFYNFIVVTKLGLNMYVFEVMYRKLSTKR